MEKKKKKLRLVPVLAISVMVISLAAAGVFGWMAWSELAERKQSADFYADTSMNRFLADPDKPTQSAPAPSSQTQPAIQPETQPVQAATEPAPQPTAPAVQPQAQPETQPAQAATEPAAPAVKSQAQPETQPVQAATDPAVQPAAPAVQPQAQPETQAVQTATEPAAQTAAPAVQSQAQPETQPVQPATEPAAQTAAPAVQSQAQPETEPVQTVTEPASQTAAPAVQAQPETQPVQAATEPAAQTTAPAVQPQTQPAAEPVTEPASQPVEEEPWDTWCDDNRHLEAGTRPSVLDFEDIQSTYPGCVGWLKIECQDIDMPLMQSTDNSYYLSHLPNGWQNILGSLFVDSSCRADFHSDVTIIHGHHIQNGMMFGNLEMFNRGEYWEQNPVFQIFTPDGDYEVQIIAGCTLDGVVFGYPTVLETEEEFEAFLQQFRNACSYDTGVEPQFGDRFVVLSTCAYTSANARFMLLGVLR